MDSSLYKDFTTSYSHTYHYFFSPLKNDAKLYLLSLHGFPSTSFDWRHQVPFFLNKGYGLIVPDYGESSEPVDTAGFRWTILTKDLVELIDLESATRVAFLIQITHDLSVLNIVLIVPKGLQDHQSSC
ncbi:hypothetical protein DFS33DRAFT_1434339 [Desarmillaria ectypa]|nr:hypothetical protein DFS33DRAFT_1434339 [Desarmillaria ectypa]